MSNQHLANSIDAVIDGLLYDVDFKELFDDKLLMPVEDAGKRVIGMISPDGGICYVQNPVISISKVYRDFGTGAGNMMLAGKTTMIVQDDGIAIIRIAQIAGTFRTKRRTMETFAVKNTHINEVMSRLFGG